MKTRIMLVALLAVFALATSAFGFSFTTSYSGPVKIKYSNYEVIAETVGAELYGIAKITSIEALNATQTQLWYSGFNGEELTATFSGYYLQQILYDAIPSPDELFFTGGQFSVYLDNTPDFNATYPGSGIIDGVNFLTLAGLPGIVTTDNLLTAFDETTTTLHSEISANTTPLTGKGSGYLSITGGDYAWLFGGIGSTLFLESDFSPPTLIRPGFGWPVVSEDPIVGTVVPEPGTFLLVGAGLVGLGFIARRRRQNS